jgi:hypothetical protein
LVRIREAINRHDGISLLERPISHGRLIRPESELFRAARARCRGRKIGIARFG